MLEERERERREYARIYLAKVSIIHYSMQYSRNVHRFN